MRCLLPPVHYWWRSTALVFIAFNQESNECGPAGDCEGGGGLHYWNVSCNVLSEQQQEQLSPDRRLRPVARLCTLCSYTGHTITVPTPLPTVHVIVGELSGRLSKPYTSGNPTICPAFCRGINYVNRRILGESRQNRVRAHLLLDITHSSVSLR